MTMVFDTLESEVKFGKFKGMTWGEILIIHPGYLAWAVENIRDGYLYITDNALEEIRIMLPAFKMDDKFYKNVEEQRIEYEDYMEEYGDIEEEQSYMYNEQNEPSSFERYNGSYAQDVMGYSDDDIDTIFDGDPDAYWNID